MIWYWTASLLRNPSNARVTAARFRSCRLDVIDAESLLIILTSLVFWFSGTLRTASGEILFYGRWWFSMRIFADLTRPSAKVMTSAIFPYGQIPLGIMSRAIRTVSPSSGMNPFSCLGFLCLIFSTFSKENKYWDLHRSQNFSPIVSENQIASKPSFEWTRDCCVGHPLTAVLAVETWCFFVKRTALIQCLVTSSGSH